MRAPKAFQEIGHGFEVGFYNLKIRSNKESFIVIERNKFKYSTYKSVFTSFDFDSPRAFISEIRRIFKTLPLMIFFWSDP